MFLEPEGGPIIRRIAFANSDAKDREQSLQGSISAGGGKVGERPSAEKEGKHENRRRKGVSGVEGTYQRERRGRQRKKYRGINVEEKEGEIFSGDDKDGEEN